MIPLIPHNFRMVFVIQEIIYTGIEFCYTFKLFKQILCKICASLVNAICTHHFVNDTGITMACKKDIINEYTQVVREAGLTPVIVDVNTFSIGNSYEINNELDTDRTIALVDVGASTVNINVLKGGVTVFTRDAATGSNRHTEALQQEFGLDYEAAEKLKQGEAVT